MDVITTVMAALAAVLALVVILQYRSQQRLVMRISQLETGAASTPSKPDSHTVAEQIRCVHEGVVEVSPNGTILGCNPAAEQILGSPAMSLRGHLLRDFYLLPDNCDEFMQRTREEGRITERPAVMRKIDGTKTLVQVSMSRVDNGDGPRMVQVLRDCSDLRTMQERLLQNERLATVGKFASQIAHEVRNPLSSISLNLEILEDSCREIGGDAAQLIRSVLGEIDRLNEVVSEYLQFSRFPKPHPKKCRIDTVIREVETRFTSTNGIRLTTQLVSPSPEIWFDPALVRQALDNLVRNAAEAIEGEGEIQIETELIDRFLTIRVRDNGRGIPPDVQSQLFEPFFTTKASGTGLGLATTQQIIFEHNGHIQVESKPGQGSTFTVFLPR